MREIDLSRLKNRDSLDFCFVNPANCPKQVESLSCLTRVFEWSAAKLFKLFRNAPWMFRKHLARRKLWSKAGISFFQAKIPACCFEVQIWGCSFSLFFHLRSPNFAHHSFSVFWNRINRHLAGWDAGFGEMEFLQLGIGPAWNSWTAQFLKHCWVSLFHLNIWHSGQVNWKWQWRCWFDSWLLVVAADCLTAKAICSLQQLFLKHF